MTITFDDDDNQQPEAPPATQPAPRGKKPQPRAVPAYLRDLLALQGVDDDALDGIDTRTAWVRIESTNGATSNKPLAHLAPDALDTLADWGHEAHTTFEIRGSQGGDVLGYFAVRLDEIEKPENDGAEPNPDRDLIDLIARQQMQLNALSAKLEAGAADPLASIEKAMAMFDRVAQIMQRMPQPQAAPAPSGGIGIGRIIDTIAEISDALPAMRKVAGGAAPQAPEDAAPDGS